MVVRIGTSGFLYEHWRHRFYPASARGAELEHYACYFDTVELNVTFYRMPSKETFRSWASRVPDNFLFAVKASRYLTHVRRLQDPEEPVSFLMERVAELGTHLGPILLQLPPDMPIDLARLDAALDAFPPGTSVAVEPRHTSWFNDGLRDLLRAHGAALCLADRRGPLTPQWATTDWSYLRFHGGRASPRPCYSAAALATWAMRLGESAGTAPDAFAYFNNDHRGCALRDAGWLARLLVEKSVEVRFHPALAELGEISLG